MSSSSSGGNIQQVAARVAHELIEMKAQSSVTDEYLRESATQAQFLQLEVEQAHHQDNQTSEVIRLVEDYTSPAVHALHNIIGCNSKNLFQDHCNEEFTEESFSQLHPPVIEARDIDSNSSHDNQDYTSSSSGILSRVFAIQNQSTESSGDNPEIIRKKPPQIDEPIPTQEAQRDRSQIDVNVSSDVPTVSYVRTLLEANEALHNFENQTGTKYSAYKSTAGFGNTEYKVDRPHKIYFEERSADLSGLGIPYDGIPFINVGKKVMDCQYGMDRCVAAKRKYMERQLKDFSRQRRPLAQERTKKIKCRAQIRMKEILKYPEYKVPLNSRSRKERVRLSKELREALKNGMVKGEKRIYIQWPGLADHTGHSLGQQAVKQVKPCLSGKQAIKEVNALSWDSFIQRFGSVVEHGQIVASAAWSKRPFANITTLHSAFCEFLDSLSHSGSEALFRCYPDLQINSSACKPISEGAAYKFQLSQLQTFSPEESALLAELNVKYRDNFHFSYIICGRETSKEGLFTSLHTRTQNSRDVEVVTAMEEIKKIAWYRILDQVRTIKPFTTQHASA
ncbi:uncharacterized protein LOC110990366 isoform X1 [Acanthaster planci]|uniref:2-oxo-4-hydroxy-4-carboxy-5-ureidoimidazoline decarboxylase n=1 Tax=Acanthaster planci TaxID=133434 RepID=A0A8B7ZZU9_ACAPL|nr:uncharacterized protein LOC110990366 isoform X1 [Acanthaster planci]